MRFILLYTSILFLSTLSKAQEKFVEDALYNCLVFKYDTEGLNIEAFLDSLENHYITEGIIKDNNGSSKFEFYRLVAESGEIPTVYAFDIAEKVSKVEFSSSDINQCIRSYGIDAETLKSSKFYSLIEAYQLVDEINPQTAAECQIKILTPKDFDHHYYRAHFLLTLAKIQGSSEEFKLK